MSPEAAIAPASAVPAPSVVPCAKWGPIPDPNVIPMPHGPAAATPARSLFDLDYPSCDDGKCLLGNRYLCRGGGMLLVGPTGIGKSAAVMQCAISWGAGRSAFGISPSRPLKILLIQAENDDGDMAEMREGVLAGLNLTPEELLVARLNVMVITEDARAGLAFIALLHQALANGHPDLVIIDPAFAYVGGSVTDQAAVTAFLRSGLTPLLRQHDCGAIIIHHTNKPAVGKEKGGWQAGDFAYAGGGSSEWGNWARAVIVIRSIGCHDVFELVLAKRGGRLGWKEADGVTKSYKKMIGHSKVESQIFWHELTEAECEERGLVKDKIDTSQEDVMALVPVTDDIAKSLLTARAQAKGIGENRAKRIIKGLIEEGHLVEVSHRRQGSRPAVHVARVSLVVQEVTE